MAKRSVAGAGWLVGRGLRALVGAAAGEGENISRGRKATMALVAMATVLLLGGGCAPTSGAWKKPGVTQARIDRDEGECVQEAAYPSYDDPSLPRGVLQSVIKVDRARYVACMQALGYQQGN